MAPSMAPSLRYIYLCSVRLPKALDNFFIDLQVGDIETLELIEKDLE